MFSCGTNFVQENPKDIEGSFVANVFTIPKRHKLDYGVVSSVVSALMVPMYQEAEKILDEGIVDSWDEIDLALIMGAGFPPFRGGLSSMKQ